MDIVKELLILKECPKVGLVALNNFTEEELNNVDSLEDLFELYERKICKGKVLATIDDLRKFDDKVSTLLQANEYNGIETISKFDRKYFPEALKKIKRPPVILFAKGDKNVLNRDGIAVIGTRDIFDYAKKIGERIGEVIVAKYGFTVISGLAEGCDTAGHRGCLNGYGQTIAFVATPLDKVYPKNNAKLQEEILEAGGCVVSEYGLGEAVGRMNFVERDRLQCGLARGTIVVSTGVTGGTMHAVNGTLELHKPLACFDYGERYYNQYEQACGNRKLINEHKAMAIVDEKTFDEFMRRCGYGEVSMSRQDAGKEVQGVLF